MTAIPQSGELLKQLTALLKVHRVSFRQERVFQHVALLLVTELVVFARNTVTQLLMSVGWTERDWSSWYRQFSHGRVPYEGVSAALFGETLKHVGADEGYVVAGDGTQTRRSSRKMEGAHWLHNPQSPVFKPAFTLASAGSSTVGCCQLRMATVAPYPWATQPSLRPVPSLNPTLLVRQTMKKASRIPRRLLQNAKVKGAGRVARLFLCTKKCSVLLELFDKVVRLIGTHQQ